MKTTTSTHVMVTEQLSAKQQKPIKILDNEAPNSNYQYNPIVIYIRYHAYVKFRSLQVLPPKNAYGGWNPWSYLRQNAHLTCLQDYHPRNLSYIKLVKYSLVSILILLMSFSNIYRIHKLDHCGVFMEEGVCCRSVSWLVQIHRLFYRLPILGVPLGWDVR